MKLVYEGPMTERDLKPRNRILNILSDGRWHRYSEIEEKATMSSATLSKHLKKLLKDKKIERQTDPKDWRVSQYRVLTEGLVELSKSRDIQFIVDHTFGEMAIPEDFLREIIEKEGLVKDVYGPLEKRRLDKEARFFLEENKKENIEWRVDSISIKHYVHGLTAYKGDKRVLKVFVKYLLENMMPPDQLASWYYRNGYKAVRDFMVILSIMPKTAEQFEETEGFKRRERERFVRWAKVFRNVDVDPESISSHQELFQEFKKKMDDYGKIFVEKS